MGPFKKKADPISNRSRELNAEIAALENKIKKLAADAQNGPRLRSTAVPHGPRIVNAPPEPEKAPAREPIFEEMQPPMPPPGETSTPDHFNELGVRKYDLPALFRRLQNSLRGRTTSNPKLVSYLAAGSIQGLRPLRYEKRVARNRFIFLSIIFLLILWGIIAVLVRHH
jgi:hypothetical protein